MKTSSFALELILILLAGTGYADNTEMSITVHAQSDRLWTGVSVSSNGRICVCHPRWSMDNPVSVGELIGDELVPLPDSSWNAWIPGEPYDSAFVCVQSIDFDAAGRLWVLDTGNPWMSGVLSGACRLLCFGSGSTIPELAYYFPDSLLMQGSYLNDFRVDIQSGYAYITDSGAGALIVTNLYSGESRRLLDGHPACMSEGTVIEIDDIAWTFGGVFPDVHSDGIALTPAADWLWWHALTGNTLYRIPTLALVDDSLEEEDIESSIEEVCRTGPVDGMIFGADTTLYITLLNESAIGYLPAGHDSVMLLLSDTLLCWSDTFAIGPDGKEIWVTVSRIHEGATPSSPYSLLRIR
ncbi:MAG: L-dopachrome tautomerase-related protein [Candidatus Fermentibacteria bacterium]